MEIFQMGNDREYMYEFDGRLYVIKDTETSKTVDALDGSFHSKFDKFTGEFSRWGKTEDEDPSWLPIGPEILDLEISVNGCPNNCKFCLPAGVPVNTPSGFVNIEDLRVGDKVFGFNFATSSVREETVEQLHNREYEGLMVIVELECGRIVEMTEDHIVMLANGKEVRAGDLSLSDDVVLM
jgi:hypothetical protein